MILALEIFILFFPGGNRGEKSTWSFRESTPHCKRHPLCIPADAETWIPCNLQNTTCFNTALPHMDICFSPIKLVVSEQKIFPGKRPLVRNDIMFKGQSDLRTLSTNSTKHLYKYLTWSGKQFCRSPSVAWSVWQEAHTQSCVCDKWNPNPATHGSTSVHTPNTEPDLQTGCWDYKWLTSPSQEFPSVLLKYSCACFHRSTFICIYINIHRFLVIPRQGQIHNNLFCFSLEHLCDQISARDFTSPVPAAAPHPVLVSSLSCAVLPHTQGIKYCWNLGFWRHLSFESTALSASIATCKAGKL